MKGITVNISLSGHLREWLTSRFGNPVRLPARSYEQEVLRRSLSKPPADWKPTGASEDCVTIVIPDDDIRRPEVYCYLGRRGTARMREVLTSLFTIDLWQSLRGELLRGKGLQQAIDRWCMDRDISLDYREAVRQKFYRMRRAYEQYGVAAGKKYQKK